MKIILLLLLLTFTLFASIGKIISYDGDVSISRGKVMHQCKIGFTLSKKDVIKTFKNSKVKIYFNDNTRITMGQNAKLHVKEYLYSKNKPSSSKTNFKFLKGAFSVITGKIGKVARKRFKIQTKTATIGIRGTVIVGNQREIACTRGAIDVSSKGKTVTVPAGKITQTLPDRAPSTPQKYSNEQINIIDTGVEANSNIFRDTSVYSHTNKIEMTDDVSGQGGSAKNIVIYSNVENASNIAQGSMNTAEQNIHSIDAQGGEVEYIYIRGKAYDVKNISDGFRNQANQNIGTIKVR